MSLVWALCVAVVIFAIVWAVVVYLVKPPEPVRWIVLLIVLVLILFWVLGYAPIYTPRVIR